VHWKCSYNLTVVQISLPTHVRNSRAIPNDLTIVICRNDKDRTSGDGDAAFNSDYIHARKSTQCSVYLEVVHCMQIWPCKLTMQLYHLTL